MHGIINQGIACRGMSVILQSRCSLPHHQRKRKKTKQSYSSRAGWCIYMYNIWALLTFRRKVGRRCWTRHWRPSARRRDGPTPIRAQPRQLERLTSPPILPPVTLRTSQIGTHWRWPLLGTGHLHSLLVPVSFSEWMPIYNILNDIKVYNKHKWKMSYTEFVAALRTWSRIGASRIPAQTIQPLVNWFD